MKKIANQTAKVNAFMDELDHPFKPEVEAVRAIIKGVNENIHEEIKWNAPSFSYKDYLVTFNLWEKKRIHLVFHNPRISEVKSDLLEGDYEHRRMAYFSDMNDVKAGQAELEKVVLELVRMMDENATSNVAAEPESDLPANLAKPAQRALSAAGYVRLEQFAKLTEAEVLRLHGMGPKALGQLRSALAAKGLSFAG